LLANGLGWLTTWFAKLGYKLTELTNQLLTLEIWFMGFAIWFAVLGMQIAELAN